MDNANTPDWMNELFGHGHTGESVHEAYAREKAAQAAEKAERDRLRCPKCAGAGRLPQFQHRNGGECFLCGGSGVFAGYTA